ncbi:MAG: PQQ-like beta-propeller repeat protein [Planctomycetes bacterium]|nr:PQQ-like beta-propeller repeat protein [Planctomycetota bacterium]
MAPESSPSPPPGGGTAAAPRSRRPALLVLMLVLITIYTVDAWRHYLETRPSPPIPEFDGTTELERGEAPAAPAPAGSAPTATATPTAHSGPAPDPAAPASGHDWSQWRGPARTGVSSENGWFSPWPGEGPRRLWKASLGAGYASVAIAAGRVYSMGYAGGRDTVWCLDAATGELLWKQSYRTGSDVVYPGPRATPTVEGNRVFTLSRKGLVFCFDAADGRELWHHDVADDPGAKPPAHGFAGSLVLVGELLVLCGGKSGVALRPADGSVAWGGGIGDPGYASPLPFEAGGKKGVLLLTGTRLLAVDPVDGRAQWEHPWGGATSCNAADPIVSGGRIFLSAAYGVGSAVLDLSAVPPRVVWKNEELSNHTSSSVLVDGMLYGFDGLMSTPATTLKCVEFATGTTRWSQPGLSGSLCAADGKLLVLTDAGELLVVEASPAAYKELARAQVVGKDCYTMPVLANGRIYCRNLHGELVCVRSRGD